MLTKFEEARSLSFKVTIKAEDFEKANNPAIWPYRVVVRKFVNFRRKETDEFAPNQQQVRGVRQLGQGAGGQGQAQHHQGAAGQDQAQHQRDHQQQHVTPVFNRFNVPGFRDGENQSH